MYFVECDGQIHAGEHASEAPVGCRLHLDATPKDASNRPTTPKGEPRWTYSDSSLFTVAGKNPYTPVLNIKRAGDLTAYCTIDGVRSNDVNVRFK